MSLWTGVPNKLAGDSNQQWNHYMSFKPPYAHSCILQQDGNILYLCVTVCFLRYKLTYLKSLKVSDLHPCLKRCSVRCDEARPCSVSLYSLMGLWGWRVRNECNEVIFIPRSLFASFVPYLKNVSQILAGAFNVNLNVVKVHSWTGTHSSSCDGAEVSSSSVFFFLLAYLYSWVYIITIYIYIWKDTNSGCPLRLRALCLPGSFYSSSFVVEKRAEGQDLHRHCYNTRMWLWERVISRFHVSPDHCLFRQSSWAPNVCFKVFECDCVASF